MQPVFAVLVAVLSLQIALCTGHFARADEASPHMIELNEEMQTRIGQVIDGFVVDPSEEEAQRSAVRLFAFIDELGRDEVEWVRQLLYHNTRATGVKEGMFMAMALQWGAVTQSSIVRAIVPYLDTTDRKLLRGVEELAGRIEGRTRYGPPDYGSYEEYIRFQIQRGEEPDAALMLHMYGGSPSQALQSMTRLYFSDTDERKPVLWAEHVVADALWKRQHGFLEEGDIEAEAVEQLDFLSRHNAWWARLYVAEILRQEPEFRTAELVQRLRDDQHPLVRKVVSELVKRKTR